MNALHFWLIAMGIGLAAGPVLLHLLMQEKPKRVIFPALRFVFQRQQTARRSIRLRHWILLAMRVAVIALVALALSRPAAATALFGSYLLLGVTVVSGLFFLFLTWFWRNKGASDASNGATPAATVSKRQSLLFGKSASKKNSAQFWPVLLLFSVVVGHFAAASWLVWQLMGNQATPLLSGKQPVAAAIVVDTSPRMQYRFNNQTRLERAQELAKEIIKQMPAGSQVSIVDTSPQPPGLSLDLAAADQQIDSLETTFLPQPILTRSRSALELLQDSPLENRELYIISDLSRPTWATGGRKRKLIEDEDEQLVYLVDVGMKSFENWTIDSWTLPSPSITPGGVFQVKATVSRKAIDGSGDDLMAQVALDQATVGKSSAGQGDDEGASAEVAQNASTSDAESNLDPSPDQTTPMSSGNKSDLPSEARTIRLMIEKPEPGRPVYRNGETLAPSSYWERFTQVSLSPGQSIEVNFSVPNLPNGEHQGWIEIDGGDAMPFDNRRNLTVRVEDAWKTLVVNGPGVSDSNLVEAIAPTGIREKGQASFDCTTISTQELPTVNLTDYKVIFLLDPDPLSETTWIQLSTYVAKGGSLALFLGHNALDPTENRQVIDASFNSLAAQKILPGRIDNPWRRPDGTLFFDPRAWDHPMFAKMQPLKTQLGWSRLPVFMHFELVLDSALPTQPNSDPNAIDNLGNSDRADAITDASNEGANKQESKDPADKPPAKSVRILAAFSNNIAAVAETLYGQGQVMTMTTPITDPTRPEDGRRPWNSFAVGGDWSFTYWLMITELSKYMATHKSAALNGMVGDSFVLLNDLDNAPQNYALYRPENQEPLEMQVDKGKLYLDFNDRPGPYRLRGTGQDKSIFLRNYSVNIGGNASDLSRIAKPQLDSLLGQGKYTVAETADQIVRNQGKGRIGLEFYPSLIRLLAILFLAEMLFSNWFYQDPTKPKNILSPAQ